MKTETQQFYGIDANLETSLFEYGIAVREDSENSYTVIYSIGNGLFDSATITNTECNYLTKESWFDFQGLLSFTGCTSENWYDLTIEIKIYDMLQYYGYQNIFGNAYTTLTEEEVREITGLN